MRYLGAIDKTQGSVKRVQDDGGLEFEFISEVGINMCLRISMYNRPYLKVCVSISLIKR